jgi:hypothetical protein
MNMVTQYIPVKEVTWNHSIHDISFANKGNCCCVKMARWLFLVIFTFFRAMALVMSSLALALGLCIANWVVGVLPLLATFPY